MSSITDSVKKAYFIGIGGIGISALVRLFVAKGITCAGCDDTIDTHVINMLQQKGVAIFEGTQNEEVYNNEYDLIVTSVALVVSKPDFIELLKKEGKKIMTYPEVLGALTKEFCTIAISGTHGKTTTTAMTAHIFEKEGLSPSVVVGSLLSSGTNYIEGTSNILIVEADEYQRAFLNLHPTYVAINNIEHDHPDCYKDLKEIQDTFFEFVSKVPDSGGIICNSFDPQVWDLVSEIPKTLYDYSEVSREKVNLPLPGEHNISNAQVAITIAKLFGIPEESSIKHLESFPGTWRRAEYKGKTKKGAVFYDDYAHHPTAVKLTLEGFRALFPDKHMTALFQPHLYSRTKTLYKEYAQSFDSVDSVILLPIYGARENSDGTTTEFILQEMQPLVRKKTTLVESLAQAVEILEAHSTDIIVSMGAGDIYKISEMMNITHE